MTRCHPYLFNFAALKQAAAPKEVIDDPACDDDEEEEKKEEAGEAGPAQGTGSALVKFFPLFQN